MTFYFEVEVSDSEAQPVEESERESFAVRCLRLQVMSLQGRLFRNKTSVGSAPWALLNSQVSEQSRIILYFFCRIYIYHFSNFHSATCGSESQEVTDTNPKKRGRRSLGPFQESG